MFVGRKAELSSLNNNYLSDSFQFAVIYGRRRVGKSTLINEFNKGKKSIFYVAIQSTAKENIAILSEQIYSVLAPEAPRNPFSSFREAIDYVFAMSEKERIVFTIDEYPYLAENDKSVSSVLQAAIDKYQADSKLFLILCGSSMSFMENQVLGYKSPLYGRRTSQYKILPFDYLESSEMLPRFSNEDRIKMYGITSGIPEYLSRVKSELSLKENVQRLFFEPAGRLFEEPTNLLKQELKMPETYNAIIAAIASGSSKLNEIATKVGIETSQCSNMLSSLISLNIVRKEIPITETKSKKSIYALDDWMFVFWYRFVLPDISRITAGFGEDVCNELFEEKINSHAGRVFEVCCKQYMWHAMRNKSLPISFSKIGRWWGNNPKMRCEEEIDFIALSSAGAIFCECKWQKNRFSEDILDELIRKSDLLSFRQNVYFYLFSKSEFSKSLTDRTSIQKNVSLINVDDMFF